MLIKRSKYDALVDENLSLRKKNADLESSNLDHLRTIKLKEDGITSLKTVVANQLETIKTRESIISELVEQNEQLSNKLHKKDQPRQSGGKFGKK